MNTILNVAQIATGIAAVISIFFTMYVYRSQKLDNQVAIAMNISSWNIEMSQSEQEELANKANPDFFNGNDNVEWHNAPNCHNITMNNNSFPVYNLIIAFVPNYFDLNDTDSLSQKYQHFYYEVLTPGKTMTDFVNDHSMGNGSLVPELYFTDNNNIQWHRSKNGTLKKTTYIDKAVNLGIILKHL